MVSLKPEQYTVGWIAALPDEITAALELLDEEHDTPTDWTQPPRDINKYYFGRISRLNVILACLPLGGIGTNNAAVVATTMISTFPQVRFGLMVGIGAGVPELPNRDIRLGDVVVSKPGDDNGGVVQWDKRKAHGDGTSKSIGTLAKPPMVLLAAASGLDSKQTRRKTKIAEMVHGINQAIREEENYQYQGPENDKLFDDRTEREVSRGPAKQDRAKGPRIFFGTIASGNTVVKNGKTRAEIIELVGKDTMCIEMEAAGLMDSFPCIVIRGICDYADSHKNDKWQRYAALTAATTAKELLLDMNAGEVERTKTASDAVENSEAAPPPYQPPAPTKPGLGGSSGQANSDELAKLMARLDRAEAEIRNQQNLQGRIKVNEDKIGDLQEQIARLSTNKPGNANNGNGDLQKRLERAELELKKLKKRVEQMEADDCSSGGCC
ncbi:hypothetical protein BFW01_g7318 [Lasiodiplodia theobromae]|nr:hypothetical protein BFW01_g7318 [Lasiodiplodia theobromae]